MAIPQALQDWYNQSQEPSQPTPTPRTETVGMLARQGRNGDTSVAHLTPGEVVVPKEIAATRPDLMAQVANTTQVMGGDPSKLVVGQGNINPTTGIEEFATSPNITNTASNPAIGSFSGSADDIRNWTNDYLNTNPGNYRGVYDQAVKSGVSADQLDSAMGGTWNTTDWTNANNLSQLTPRPAKALPKVDSQYSASTYQPSLLGDPTKWNIDPSQTVAGQLNGILSGGSPLMQQAQTAGLETANSRGLLNSSMAAGDSQNAMISAATPIANADATANLGINRYNTDTSNQFATTNAAASNTANQFNSSATNNANQFNSANAFTKQQTATQNAFTKEQNATQNAFTQQQSLFDANVKSSLAQIDNQASFTKQSQQLYAGLSDGFNKAITSINQDVNMNQQSKDYSIQQLYNAYKAQISLLSAVGSVPDVSTLLTSS